MEQIETPAATEKRLLDETAAKELQGKKKRNANLNRPRDGKRDRRQPRPENQYVGGVSRKEESRTKTYLQYFGGAAFNKK